MCGLAGALLRHGALTPGREISPENPLPVALAMAETLSHRGPDGTGAWVSPSGICALAHTRLKVIDLETGDQPMANEDGSVQAVFNGEIYNFRELRSELEGKGHRFRTRSDTEVLVHGWEEWGEGLPARLDGMFAFAVWDEPGRSLFLSRDRTGKKPLYIYEDAHRLVFASELKAILSVPDLDDSLDPRAFPFYLTYGYVPTPGTFYKRVAKVPPGSWLSVEGNGGNRQGRYWRLEFSPTPVSEGGAKERLRTLLAQAVERRLVSDVPLGAFLSGGIDSTIVVGLMSRLLSEPVRTFSIGMADDPNYDETYFARVAAKRFGTKHTAFTVGAQEVGLLEDLLDAYDEPFGDSSGLPTYIVSRLTREAVTVALTGDGGDELFAGYPRFLGMALAEKVPGWVAGWGNALTGLLPHNDDFRSLPRRAQRFLSAAALPEDERMLRWIGFFGDRLDAFLRPDLADLLSREELTESFRVPLERNARLSVLARALSLNFETYLLDDLLVKADRCSMAHGLELRSPFLDTAVMEFAAGLPDRFRIRGTSLKYLLKESFRDLLPDEIRRRGKMGFGVPLPVWFRTHWRPLVEDRILDPESPLWQWIHADPVRSLVREHMAETHDHGHQIWALLTLDGWLRRGRFSLPS